jgi:WD40 repeat protein
MDGTVSRSFSNENDSYVFSANFSPNGRFLVMVTGSRTVGNANDKAVIWDVDNGRQVGTCQLDGRLVHTSFSPNSRSVLVATGQIAESSGEYGGEGVVFMSGSTGQARLWSTENGKEVTPILRHEGLLTHAAFSPDGRFVVTCGTDNVAKIWNARSGDCVLSVQHEATITHAAVDADGRWLLTASDDRTARIWEIDSGVQTVAAMQHGAGVSRAIFGPNNRLVLTVSDDDRARLWDAFTGEPITPWIRHDGPADAVSISPQAAQLATTWKDGVLLWDLQTSTAPFSDLRKASQSRSLRRVDPIAGLVPMQPGELGDVLKSLPDNDRGLSTTHNLVSWHAQEVDNAHGTGNWFAEIWHLDQLIAQVERDDLLYVYRGNANNQLGEFQQAFADASNAIEQSADREVRRLAYFERGTTQALLRQWQQAVDDYTESINNGTQNLRTHQNRGDANAELGQWAAASADFEQALSKNKNNNVEIWLRLALCRLAADDKDGHRTLCAEIMKRFEHPDDARTAVFIPLACYIRAEIVKDHEEHVKPLLVMMKQVPRREWKLNTLPLLAFEMMLYRAGQFRLLSEDIKKQMEGEGDDSGIYDWLFLSMCLSQLGQMEEAQNWFDRAAQGISEVREHSEKHLVDWPNRFILERILDEAKSLLRNGKE